MTTIWAVLVGIFVFFLIISTLFFLRALFKTKVLQRAQHFKRKVKSEAAWVWRIALALILLVGIGEYVKLGNPIMSSVLSMYTIFGLFLFALGFWVCTAAMDARRQYLWFWQVLGPKEQLPAFSKHKIYSTIRHPRELAILLLITGLALTFGLNYTAILTVVVLLPAIMFLVSAKDRFLIEKHGKTYIDYSRTSNKLIPYLW